MQEYYRVMAEVSLDAIAHNIKEIKKVLHSHTELMAIVKADAYGHGVNGILKTLVQHQVNRLGVAILDEGIQLRKQGIDLPILILGYTPEVLCEKVVEYDLTQTIFTYEMAKAISDAACKLGRQSKVHVKIDTGMGRIGFLCQEDSLEIITRINELPNLKIEGIFSHFSKADEKDKHDSHKQLERFEEFVRQLQNRGVHVPTTHIANSAGIIDLHQSHYNMVRAGIILYGLYPSDEVDQLGIDLRPAMSLKTHVIFIKEVKKGTPISYGGTYVTDETKRIATIPVGYGDGYSRLLSSKGRVLINGEYAPILGRICMDQFMVDVTHMEELQVGDEVILFGEKDGKSITVEEIASLIGTINYEIVCMLGKRVPRVYVE